MTQESMVGARGQEPRWLQSPDGRLAVEIRGGGPARPDVVCLHGLSANRTTWYPVAERLEDRLRLVLIDLLGRGDSDPAPGAAFDLPGETRRLAWALEQAAVVRPILAGHSHGASLALALAETVGARALFLVNPVTPELRRPLALLALRSAVVRRGVAPLLRLFRRPLTRYMLERRVFADRRRLPRDAVDRYSAPWRDRDRALGMTRVLADWDPADLRPWSGPADRPVRVLAGSADRRIRPELARRWAETLGGSCSVVPDCGHSVPEEAPDQTAAELLDLLDSMDDETTAG